MPIQQNPNKRRGEERSETLIIPHITREMLEVARAMAEKGASRAEIEAALAGMQPDGRGINKITGCHVVPHLQKITKNERAAKARPYRFFYCLTVQRLRSRPMRSK